MARALLDNLKALDIQLWAEGDKLKWDAPVGLVKGELKEQMRNHKAELLALIRDKEADAYHQGYDSKSSKEDQHKNDSVSEDTEKQLPLNTIILGDCLEKLKTIPDSSIDLIATDPPFGIGFMGKAWDTFKPNYINDKMAKDGRGTADGIISARPALVAGTYDHTQKGNRMFQRFICEVSKECLRVLKPGAFMFMCMTPRQDSLARAIVGIENAGFKVGFTSMYWTYASGFLKARNISKAIDKKLGAERKKLVRNPNSRENCDKSNTIYEAGTVGKTAYYTEPVTEEAKRFNGSYAGFQPKPAVEVIIIAMKPRDNKTYADQALSNGKGITWLNDCIIPFDGEDPRLPANLIISDDILDDGRKDPGGYSRFFSLDAWAEFNLQDLPELVQQNLPFIIVPKASKKEKDAGLVNCKEKPIKGRDPGQDGRNVVAFKARPTPRKNTHPTVKPIKLMAYLIAMGSRENDIVLDPFAGSGTTCIAAKTLNRRYIGIELSPEYREIAVRRLENVDKDNTIKKSIHEAFKVVEDVNSEKIKIVK
jgi:DNA modification methylase